VPAPAEEGIPLVEGEEEVFEEVELWETSPESEAHEGEGEDGAGVGGEDAEPLEAEPAPVVEPEAGLEAEPEAVPDEPSPGSQE
jgi:hypothetical protein